jgi:hypothetical protein
MDVIAEHLAAYPDSPIVLDLLGTLDPDAIRRRVHDLDPEAEEIFFFRASVGALFGIRRRNGQRVAMKVHKLFSDPHYIGAVQQIQSGLVAAGFPSPRPLGHRDGVTWEEWRDDGEFRDAHDADVRTAMARLLARFHELATASAVRPRHEFLRPTGALWPKPHNALFDFDGTSAGAERIDEIAAAARRIADRIVGREVVGHADWSAKHIRFDENLRATAVYDWDSVETDSETAMVGTAAASFTYTEELGDEVARWPSPAESLAFIDDYEQARGRPFTAAERRAALAADVYLIAYAARCYHAVGGDPAETGLETHAALI